MATKDDLHWAIIPSDLTTPKVTVDRGHLFDLLSLKTNEAVVYGKRRWGINLVWGDPKKSDNLRFARQSGASGPVLYGEKIAIHVRRGKWLRYKRRRTGINLNWSKSARYEWKILGGKTGTPVKTGVGLNLYNEVEDDFLIYDPRDWGINLKWSRDKGKFNDLSAAVRAATDIKEYAVRVRDYI